MRRVRLMVAVLVEGPALELLAELGWAIVDAYVERLGPTGTWVVTPSMTWSWCIGSVMRCGG